VCNGELGVGIFFVLSGFLISYLLVSEKESTYTIELKNFYMRRVLRIWPLYYMVLFFTFFLFPLFKSIIGSPVNYASSLGYHLCFLSNFDLININHLNLGETTSSQNITWSISVEEQFYLFWPLIFKFIDKKFWLSIIVMIIFGSQVFKMYHLQDYVVLKYHTLSVINDLAIGSFFALITIQYPKIKHFFEKMNNKAIVALFVLLLSVLYLRFFINISQLHFTLDFIITLFFGLIITSQSFAKDTYLGLNKLKFADKWGKYTYGIYLLHPIALLILEHIFSFLHIPIFTASSLIAIALLGIPLTLGISYCSFNFYENYFIRLKRYF
jgi:peptidoglycan/LPS O-acetylase OafA/YrhL